jgi:regulator of sigma E protease
VTGGNRWSACHTEPMSWVLTIAGICALVVLHELGHFIAAKAVGMRVERFSLFFPPKLIGIRRGETEYMIGAIPAGGYVKITGMSPEELEGLQGRETVDGRGAIVEGEAIEELDPEIVARAYCNQAPWKRIVVILAGPAVNLLIAFLIFWAILITGSVDGAFTLENLNPSIQTRVSNTNVALIQKGEPAASALRLGDRILTVDGRHATVDSAITAIGAHRCPGAQYAGCRAATPVHLTVLRGGRVISLSVYPRYSATDHRMLIGFGFGASPKSYGVFTAAGTAIGEMWGISVRTLTNIGHAFTSAKTRGELHTIVGISEIANEAVTAGAGFGLVVLGFISLVLAVVNLFPFLPLDGGHVVWALGEKLRGGQRISVTAMWRYSSVGIVLFAFLFINGLSNDISRLGG